MTITILTGCCLSLLQSLSDQSVHTCVTSPPYWGLRDYGQTGQLGLEQSPSEYVRQMVAVFREVRRVLRDDGSLWMNLGDSYAGPAGGNQGKNGQRSDRAFTARVADKVGVGLKPKDLVGIPWRVAFALQDDGWYLRSDIIWCLSGGAWLYAKTQKGEMPVMVKDLVRLNPATVQLWNGERWTQALGWGKNANPTNRIELVLRSGERIGCTGDHLWPTQRGNVRAAELELGDVVETCRLPEPGTSDPGHLTPDAAWLVGLYLAEGSRSGNTIQLALHADESHWLERIGSVARHYGGSSTHTIDGNMLDVRIYGRILNALIDEYIGGRNARDKSIKVAAWRLSNQMLRRLTEGYLDGDGHFDAANNRFRLGFARNYNLERDLRVLAARLGAILTLAPTVAKSQFGRFPAFRGEWRWQRTGNCNERDRGEVVAIRKSRARQFWDISVADAPHLFALASGVLTHNCKPNPMPERVTDRPTKSHEYIFLLSKSEKYYYDQEAIAEPVTASTIERMSQPTLNEQKGSDRVPGKTNGTMKAVVKRSGNKERKSGIERGCSDSCFALFGGALKK